VFLLRTCCTRKLFAVCHHESVWDDRKELETTRNSLIVFNQKGGVRQNIYCSFPYTLKIKGSKIICIYVHFLVPQRTILIIWRTLKEPFAQWKVIMDFKGSFAMQESLFLNIWVYETQMRFMNVLHLVCSTHKAILLLWKSLLMGFLESSFSLCLKKER